ncbi:uncharacterized protein LOC104583954 [Brachypodium distachyon]|nr:uncharacterized protein LOC104583954 [Brachypodium distachyon]|eukprot:XP_010236300.1 uncharacterized protein LOC104583954 [Brachypodium distachyon]
MAPLPWASLDQEALGRIFRSLPSFTDLASASQVCRHWRSVALLRENQPQPALPWLLMPSTASTSHFRLFGRTTHHTTPHVPVGARFCGSFPGGWFVVALRQAPPGGRYALLNLHSGEQIALPDNMGAPVKSSTGIQHYSIYPVVAIHAAALSAAPTPDGAYIVAALTSSQTNIAFWRPGMAHWSPPLHTEVDRRASWANKMIPTATEDGSMEDVVHYRRRDLERFCVLTSTERLFFYEPVITADGTLTMRRTVRIRMFQAVGLTPAGSGEIVARYLVVSGEDLLIVRRYASLPVAPDRIGLHVFTLREEGQPQDSCLWRNCSSLDLRGKVLFLGRGCSRAYTYTTAVHRHPGGYIYLLDAERFHDLTAVDYRCSDTGRCDYRRFLLEIRRVLPRGPASDCSPWIWFFH